MEMVFAGPVTNAAADSERILRGLPEWFGIESALIAYVADTKRYPTFVVKEKSNDTVIGFLTARQHFARAWEIHCLAIEKGYHRQGVGRRLVQGLEQWLKRQGVHYLQVKTLAATHPSPEYAGTRKFYSSMAFEPLEVFDSLWGPENPALQMIKVL